MLLEYQYNSIENKYMQFDSLMFYFAIQKMKLHNISQKFWNLE